MKRSKFYFIILAFLILAFSIGFSFVMESILPVYGDGFYVTVKVVVSIAFLVVILFSTISKNDPANNIIVNVASIIFLFLPLLVRYMITREEPKYVWIYIICFIVLIVYLVLVFSVDVLNQKVNKVVPKLEGKEIEVKNEDTYYDENGNFVGAKGRGNK